MANQYNSPIHLAVAFDQNFLTPFYVLLSSVFVNNPENLVHFHAIVSGINDQEKSKLKAFARQNNGDISFYSLTEEQAGSLFLAIKDPKYTLATFYRLFIPILLPKDIERIIYIDTDIVIINDLRELYTLDFDESFAAVVDPAPAIRYDLGITEPSGYFNAGVLLINLDAWRSQQISEKALGFVGQFPEKCLYVDQCALNAVSIGHWKKLDVRYNLMGQYVPNLLLGQYEDFLDDKVIVHFNIIKPWDRLCQMRLKFLYFRYYKLSPQKGKKRFKKFTFTARNLARLARNKVLGIYNNYLALHHTYKKTTARESTHQSAISPL